MLRLMSRKHRVAELTDPDAGSTPPCPCHRSSPPAGTVAVQYGHAATAMSESYAGRSQADMLDVLDQEKGLVLAETPTEAGERIAAGESVSGPAADRYRAAAAEFSDRYAGTYLGKRELRALVANPASRSTKTRKRS